MKIRLRIKEVLAEKGMSQSKLSQKAEVSLNTIQDLTHDPYRDIRLSTLDKIAQALGVEITELYERIYEKDSPE
jgi:DNA-binding Xre family transcriptional regulator